MLISDIELPDGSSHQLMRDLTGRGVSGISISGFGSTDDVQQSREAGFREHLTTPIDASRLEAAFVRVAE